MCKQGDTVVMPIGGRVYDIDRCIHHLVAALNAGGVRTVASCCGHGNRPGCIILEDGRELFVVASFDEGRKLDQLIGVDNQGERLQTADGAALSYIRDYVSVLLRSAIKVKPSKGESLNVGVLIEHLNHLQGLADGRIRPSPGKPQLPPNELVSEGGASPRQVVDETTHQRRN